MRHSFLFFFAFLLIETTNLGFAQEFTIDTDRPDQSDGVATVPLHKFQIEEGLTVAKKTVMNNFLARYGLTNSTELRLLVDAGKEVENKGVQPVTLSVKQRIIKENKGIVPAISAVGYLSYGKWASRDFKSKNWPYRLVLAFENELSDQWTLGYNVGGSNKFRDLDLTLNLGYAPSEKVSTYLEYFSTLGKTGDEHNLNTGVLYLVSPIFQLDLAVGHSIFASEDRLFTTFGISYLFP